MGRRPSKSRFMPDVYVFPGGGVELADSRVRSATELNTKFAQEMAVSASQARAKTIAAAAIRETFEETGLMISSEGYLGNVSDPSWLAFKKLNEAPDLGLLRYLGRAITPAGQPIRFHARFFAVKFEDLNSQSSQEINGNGELLDLQWVPFSTSAEEILSDLALRKVTRYMLSQLCELVLSKDADWMGKTMFTQRNGQVRIT